MIKQISPEALAALRMMLALAKARGNPNGPAK